MLHSRPAFTIIEILVSVIILAFSIVFVLRIHSDNAEQIVYLSERNKLSLQDSLYLTTNILRHHKHSKTAKEILERHVRIKTSESRDVLKKNTRDIFIPEQLRIVPPPEGRGPTALVNEIKLKDKHSSVYWHFRILSF